MVVVAPERAVRREMEWELNKRGIGTRWVSKDTLEVFRLGEAPNAVFLYYRISPQDEDGGIMSTLTGMKIVIWNEGKVQEIRKEMTNHFPLIGSVEEVAEALAEITHKSQGFLDRILGD